MRIECISWITNTWNYQTFTVTYMGLKVDRNQDVNKSDT